MNNVKSKNILKIKKTKREIKCVKEIFEILFDIFIDLLLFVLLFSNILLTLLSSFVANEIVVAC